MPRPESMAAYDAAVNRRNSAATADFFILPFLILVVGRPKSSGRVRTKKGPEPLDPDPFVTSVHQTFSDNVRLPVVACQQLVGLGIVDELLLLAVED